MSFQEALYVVSENDGAATICVSIQIGDTELTTYDVTLSTQPASATETSKFMYYTAKGYTVSATI